MEKRRGGGYKRRVRITIIRIHAYAHSSVHAFLLLAFIDVCLQIPPLSFVASFQQHGKGSVA